MNETLQKVVTFGRITKVNAATGIVEGVAMDETPDRDGEIYDYATSKPYVEAWSNAQAETTKAAGQEVSYGNVRGQHNPGIAAGRVAQPIDFDDVAKAVRVSVKMVDKDTLEKCMEGVYTGFSVKGAVVGQKWRDGTHRRYTVNPIEISAVDVPCNPGATFTAVKADGSQEERHFQNEKNWEELTDLRGIRRFHGETPADFVERAVSTLVSKAAEKPITVPQEKTMTQEEITKMAAAEKMKAAHKGVSAMSACLGGYCDHDSTAKCADHVAKAQKAVSAAFSGATPDEAEKAAKAQEENDAEKAKDAKKDGDVEATAKKKEDKKEDDKDKDDAQKKAEKAAGGALAGLESKLDNLASAVEKLIAEKASATSTVVRPKPFVNGFAISKAEEVAKAAGKEEKDSAAIDPKDPQRVEKALHALYASELAVVSL